MTMPDDAPMLTVKGFAERRGVDERSVQRWLKAGRLVGAVHLDTGWLIPDQPRPGRKAPAEPAAYQDTAEQGALVVRAPAQLAKPPGSLAEALAIATAFLTLEEAAQLLGIPVSGIRRNAERFEVERVGPRGAAMVPARVVRHVAGLSATAPTMSSTHSCRTTLSFLSAGYQMVVDVSTTVSDTCCVVCTCNLSHWPSSV